MRPIATFALFVSSCALSVAAPLPANYVGVNRGLQVLTSGANYYPNNVSVTTSNFTNTTVGGGGFTGQFQLSGPFNTSNSYVQTTVWCVDSQLSFPSSTPSAANVNLLTTSGFVTNQVRYGTASGNTNGFYNSSQNSFVYDVGLTGAADSALNRFRMAAYLVSQYSSFPGGPTSGGTTDDAIQRAIWKIMYNNTGTNAYNFSFSDVSSGAGSGNTWIDLARTFVLNSSNSSFFNNWAVVSWTVDSTGNLNAPNTPNYQTFLVQIVPEPGFYGMLALGLSGLAVAIGRRRRTA